MMEVAFAASARIARSRWAPVLRRDGWNLANHAVSPVEHHEMRRAEQRSRDLRVAWPRDNLAAVTARHIRYVGGMIRGVSSVLHEATELDPRTARYVNDNLADYLMRSAKWPMNMQPNEADKPDVESHCAVVPQFPSSN
jgi:hypothetical protein